MEENAIAKRQTLPSSKGLDDIDAESEFFSDEAAKKVEKADDVLLEKANNDASHPKDVEDTTIAVPRKAAAKYKKAPEAPKRFKSAFIFFSAEKHKQIRAELGDKALTERVRPRYVLTAKISKVVSEAWKELPQEEKEKWETMARNDRTRYEMEKTLYKGPWHVPNKRKIKDVNAPKRPMSAFLAFANGRRAEVKRLMPGASNGEVSRALAAMWKDAPDELRQSFVDEEHQKRQVYLAAISDWRKKDEEEKRLERQQREELALHLAEELVGSGGDNNDAEEDGEEEEDVLDVRYAVGALDCDHQSATVIPTANHTTPLGTYAYFPYPHHDRPSYGSGQQQSLPSFFYPDYLHGATSVPSRFSPETMPGFPYSYEHQPSHHQHHDYRRDNSLYYYDSRSLLATASTASVPPSAFPANTFPHGAPLNSHPQEFHYHSGHQNPRSSLHSVSPSMAGYASYPPSSEWALGHTVESEDQANHHYYQHQQQYHHHYQQQQQQQHQQQHDNASTTTFGWSAVQNHQPEQQEDVQHPSLHGYYSALPP